MINDEYLNCGCEIVKKSFGVEENFFEKYWKFFVKFMSNVRSNNVRVECGEVERGGEESERNVVEFVVFVRFLIVFLFFVYGWEEFFLKWIYSCYIFCKK